MPYQIDQSEPATLIRGVATTRTLVVYDGVTQVTVDNGGTYTLYDGDGEIAATGTVNSGSVSINVDSDIALGAKAHEVWNCTVASGTVLYPVRRAVLITTAGMMHAPVTNAALIQGHRGWGSPYPDGKTSWAAEIRTAWAEIVNWLIRDTALAANAELHDPGALYQAALYGARAEVAGYMATFGDEAAMMWYRHYTDIYQDQLRSIRVRLTTNGNGSSSQPPSALAVDSASWFPTPGPGSSRY